MKSDLMNWIFNYYWYKL